MSIFALSVSGTHLFGTFFAEKFQKDLTYKRGWDIMKVI